MSDHQKEDRQRTSVVRRTVELIQRNLAEGWTCEIVSLEEEIIQLTRQKTGKTVRLTLRDLVNHVLREPERRRELIHRFAAEAVRNVAHYESLPSIRGRENQIYPVLRHSSFQSSAEQKQLVIRPHTSETIIAYALDDGQGYLLITHPMINDAGMTPEELHDRALHNLERLPYPVKEQTIGENRLFFIHPTDGYAASRVLLPGLLDKWQEKRKGHTLGVAIPHQDVLIIGDLGDQRGLPLLYELAYNFAVKGDVPLSPLPFLYDNGELEPYVTVKR